MSPSVVFSMKIDLQIMQSLERFKYEGDAGKLCLTAQDKQGPHEQLSQT